RSLGGAADNAGSDAVGYAEHPPDATPDGRDLHGLALDFNDSLITFDHFQKTILVTAHARVPDPASEPALREAYDEACRRVDDLVGRLNKQAAPPLADIDPHAAVTRGFDRSSFDPER